jgi:hypothetical protein
MSSLRERAPRATPRRCPHCASRMSTFKGERYCPSCLSWGLPFFGPPAPADQQGQQGKPLKLATKPARKTAKK